MSVIILIELRSQMIPMAIPVLFGVAMLQCLRGKQIATYRSRDISASVRGVLKKVQYDVKTS